MDSKSSLSERDIITKYILPAIEQSGWNKQTQIREEVTFTAGRIFVKGKKTKRGEKKRADIIIYYNPNIPVAVVEAKDNSHTIGAGMQQALEYANTLDIPVAISSNGDGFVIQYRKTAGQRVLTAKPLFLKIQTLNIFQLRTNFGLAINDTTDLILKRKKTHLFVHTILIQQAAHLVTISGLQSTER